MRLRDIWRDAFPHRHLSAEVNQWRRGNLPNLWRGLWPVLVSNAARFVGGNSAPVGALYLRRGRIQYDSQGQVIVDAFGQPVLAGVVTYGLASLQVVTTAGVGFIVDAFQNLVELENMKFHGFGTGATAEASGDTALVTELTTQYNPDNTRPTGTTTEGASANIYRTVATLSPDSGGTIAITEHMVVSQAATGGGVCFDRTVFAAVNVVAAQDSLQATYELTLPAGS